MADTGAAAVTLKLPENAYGRQQRQPVVVAVLEYRIPGTVFFQVIIDAADIVAIEGAAEIKTDRIELYTEPYASLFTIDRYKAIEPFIEAAKAAEKMGIDVNAGHDLNLDNLNYMYKNIPNLKEVSIGHALIADALYMGLETTIKKYLDCLK